GLSERVEGVATCGGMAPLRDRADVKELGLGVDRLLLPLSRRAPWLAAQLLRLEARQGVGKSAKRLLGMLCESDCEALLPLTIETTAMWEDDHPGAYAVGTRGTVDDYRAVGAPDWGFALEDVTHPVDCWQGVDDDLVPRAHAERLARALPDAQLFLAPDIG